MDHEILGWSPSGSSDLSWGLKAKKIGMPIWRTGIVAKGVDDQRHGKICGHILPRHELEDADLCLQRLVKITTFAIGNDAFGLWRFNSRQGSRKGVDLKGNGDELGLLAVTEIVVTDHNQGLTAIGQFRTEGHPFQVVNRYP